MVLFQKVFQKNQMNRQTQMKLNVRAAKTVVCQNNQMNIVTLKRTVSNVICKNTFA